jgi:hypothetical protein
MEKAPDNSKDSSRSACANGMNDLVIGGNKNQKPCYNE